MNFDPVIILAQETPPTAPPEGAPEKPSGGMGQMLMPMILIMVIFYFILIRPQRKQQKALETLRSNINIGDDVITAGGIHGQITGKADRTITVRVTDGTKIKFEKSAISQVFPKNKGGADAESSDEKTDGDEEADSEESSDK